MLEQTSLRDTFTLSTSEQCALLRAARGRVRELSEEQWRLNQLANRNEKGAEALLSVVTLELDLLDSAIKRLWKTPPATPTTS